MDWNDLNIVLAIARSGTLAGAARSLALNHSTVFRRINAIEKKLEVRFFERLPQGYVLTEAGEAAMRSAERIDEEVHALARELVGRDLRLQGTIRLTAPEGVTLKLLSPHIEKFCAMHPDIHIDLAVTGSALQLARREADLAVRVTAKPPDSSIGRRICAFRFGIYATRAYLKKHQNNKLADCDWVLTDDSRDWFPQRIWKKIGQSKAKTILSSNSTIAVLNAVKQGIGVAPLPCFLGDSEKTLVRAIELPKEMTLDLWLLTHPDLRHTARVKALMHFLEKAFGEQRELIEGSFTGK